MATKYSTRKNSNKAQTIALRTIRTTKRNPDVTVTRSGHVKATGKVR